LAHLQHLVENVLPFAFGKLCLCGVFLALEAQGSVIDGEIDVFRKSVYGMEDFRERCSALEEQPPFKRLVREKLLKNPAGPEIFFDDGFR
jgi:hypothetical protein